MKPFGSTMRPRTYFLPRHVRSKTISYCELATNQSHKVLSENTSSSCSTPTTTRLCTCSSLVGFINCENLRQSKPAIIYYYAKTLPPKLRGIGFYHARISPHRDIRARETHSNPDRTLTPILDPSMIKNSAPDSLAIADKRHLGYTVV
ncbi:unnamed protein product [Microthlaspi erraticum]|uniref:Uncharacterized protein n=1 Tax=Microthlaspi erraticum TaxID=1685480 RepID=A0A6D2K0D5_9BRAS|nr:unnamed protein product [Microthlaspi erraticum]